MRLWLWPAKGADAAPTVGGDLAAAVDLHDVEWRLNRVSRHDLAQVTDKDVRSLKDSVTVREVELAMRIMLEKRQFVDVLEGASPEVMCCAARGVTVEQREPLMRLAKTQMALLYNMLPFVTEDYLDRMSALGEL